MSRKGNYWDNAVMERFFLSLKMERVWQCDYANHGEAEKDITEYIVGFYNGLRLHSARGYLPPRFTRKKWLQKNRWRCLKLIDHYRFQVKGTSVRLVC